MQTRSWARTMADEEDIDETVRARLLAIKVSHDSVSLASTPTQGHSAPGSPFSPPLYAAGSTSRYINTTPVPALPYHSGSKKIHHA